MKKGQIFFHQGVTDIVCSLPLINYYKQSYDELIVVINESAKDLFKFYTRDLIGVSGKFITIINNQFIGEDPRIAPEGYDLLYHGVLDQCRKDAYNNIYHVRRPLSKSFIHGFYEAYDISHNTRVDFFEVKRDLQQEDIVYQKFIEKYGPRYMVYHDDKTRNQDPISPDAIPTSINFQNPKHCPYVNLGRISDTFFDYIKVIQNAEEIHLIDSCWGALCYQLDAKYQIFSNKTIHIHAQRNQREMFLEPKKLSNWIIL